MVESQTADQEWDAILVKGAPRFRHNRKMVPAASVPEHIKAALIADLHAKAAAPPAAPKPIEVSVASQPAPIERPDEVPLPPAYEDVAPNVSVAVEPSAPSKEEIELITEVEQLRERLFELESQAKQIVRTVDNASIFELAKAMYDNYAVYTVFVGGFPKDGDVHPFHGGIMTRYEVGVAYQNFKRVNEQGLLKRDFTGQKDKIDNDRQAPATHQAEISNRREDPHYQAPAYKTFNERTSVEGQNQTATTTVAHVNDPISEDPTVEPRLRGQVIRPVW